MDEQFRQNLRKTLEGFSDNTMAYALEARLILSLLDTIDSQKLLIEVYQYIWELEKLDRKAREKKQ